MELKTYHTSSGETVFYRGTPDLEKIDKLVEGPGDLWHSSMDQGFKDCFPELVYQTAVYWWFLNDFDQTDSAVNWRLNAEEFVIRKSVWEQTSGLDSRFENHLMGGLDYGFNLLRNAAAIPLYVKDLFSKKDIVPQINQHDRYLFYLKHFKKRHSYFMMLRKGVFRIFSEYKAFKSANKKNVFKDTHVFSPRTLNPIAGKPTVSLVIPTMKRQAYTELLLQDHNAQTYLIKEVVIVDATPKEERDSKYYKPEKFKFDIKVKWQKSKGSCRARNEAIAMCSGDYIIFADDDVRVFPDFVENHIRLMQTYNVEACNGLDIMAEHMNQDLSYLTKALELLGDARWKVGVSHMFSNANSCVKRTLVEELIGNDINFDGGYGEDLDFGFRIVKAGHVLLHNPFSPNLHLKPPVGGYRFWGNQARVLGKKRKPQPWELDIPVRSIRPIPSPTMTYNYIKHFKKEQIREWKHRYFFMHLFGNKKSSLFLRILALPLKRLQFKKSMFYANRLLSQGPKYK